MPQVGNTCIHADIYNNVAPVTNFVSQQSYKEVLPLLVTEQYRQPITGGRKTDIR